MSMCYDLLFREPDFLTKEERAKFWVMYHELLAINDEVLMDKIRADVALERFKQVFIKYARITDKFDESGWFPIFRQLYYFSGNIEIPEHHQEAK